MKSGFWEHLIGWWEKSYFTIPFLLVCITISLVVGVVQIQKEKHYLIFLGYAISAILLCFGIEVLLMFYPSDPNASRTKTIELGNAIFALIEFVAFIYFFTKVLKNPRIRDFLIMTLPIYFLLTGTFIFKIMNDDFTKRQITMFSFRLNSLEFALLLIACLAYFYEEMNNDDLKTKDLIKSPRYWVILGLFFNIIISLPFIFIGDRLSLNHSSLYRVMFSIHFLAMSFQFICMTKAFLCKTRVTI